ncbi:MAG: methionine synthase [Stackebrandtia sp.]
MTEAVAGESGSEPRRHPPALPTGVATGIGSLPGGDSVEAVRLVLGELPDFPHLPELPQRGAGADMLGRGAALLVDLPVELRAGHWQTTRRAGMDLRRANDFLERDLDALSEQAGEHDGPVKVSAAGVWTLASGIGRPIGGALLRDPGAVGDLTASLAEGLAAHVAEVSARLPHASVVLQLDEPSLPAVLAGAVPTESGFSRYRAVEADDARRRLAAIVEAVHVPVIVHCCAADVPVALIAAAGAAAVSLDLSLVDMDDPACLDPLGEQLEAGLGLLAGTVPAVDPDPAVSRIPAPTDTSEPSSADGSLSGRTAVEPVSRLWSRLGLPRHRLPELVSVTPACGMAAASPDHVRAAFAACREAARRLHD